MNPEFSYGPNTYLGSVNHTATSHAKQHALDCWPEESCGAVIKGSYVPFENTSNKPLKKFKISDPAYFLAYQGGVVDCLVHSHNDSPAASVPDQIQQRATDIPWMIINTRNRSVTDCIVFGEEKPAPLFDRPFFFGAFDCLTLVRDFLSGELGLEIPTPPHELNFFEKENSPLESMIGTAELPVTEVPPTDNIQKYDILLYDIGQFGRVNHIAVSLGGGEVLHHLLNKLSGKFPINYGSRSLTKVLRFK